MAESRQTPTIEAITDHIVVPVRTWTMARGCQVGDPDINLVRRGEHVRRKVEIGLDSFAQWFQHLFQICWVCLNLLAPFSPAFPEVLRVVIPTILHA